MDTMTDLRTAAEVAFRALETRTREDGSTFTTMTDDAPDWVRELVYSAHGEFMPEDWRYEAIRNALAFIINRDEDDEEEDGAGEFADSQVDVYNYNRYAWLASNLQRAGYCDEATEEFGPADSVSDTIGRGQYMEAREVFELVVTALREHVEAEDDEDEES